MNELIVTITIAPTLTDTNTLVIYRDNGEEVVVKVFKESKTMSASQKITPDEVNFIRENYL